MLELVGNTARQFDEVFSIPSRSTFYYYMNCVALLEFLNVYPDNLWVPTIYANLDSETSDYLLLSGRRRTVILASYY